MSDIVERLRDGSREDGQSSWMHPSPPWAERSQLLSDAADEIERLRAAPSAGLREDALKAKYLRIHARVIRELGSSMSPGALAATMERRADAIEKESGVLLTLSKERGEVTGP